MTKKKKILFPMFTFLLSVILLVAAMEGLLRVSGFKPWTYEGRDAREPTMHEPDRVLGWKNKAGSYTIPAYDSSLPDIYMTFVEDGQRLTSIALPMNSRELVTSGGSFTQGWAVNDHETYSWKLQEKYPSLKVVNYGTGGYGSYQSLLLLEQSLPKLKAPKIVLYGFNQHHESRNVATAKWMWTLLRYSRRGHVYVPYATVNEHNEIVRHPAERYLSLPFRESFATVAFIELIYMKIRALQRSTQQRQVTEKIFLEMNKVCERFGATLVVVLLRANHATKSHYNRFFKQHKIPSIDCAYRMTREMQVPGEGHPNGKMHSRWAECIANALGDQINVQKKSASNLQPAP